MAKTPAHRRQKTPAHRKQQTDDPFLVEAASAIRDLARNIVQDAIEIGRHLSEARDHMPHGKWLPWLKREFAWSRQTADNYLGVYRAVSDGKLPNFGNFDVSSLFLLSKRSTPKTVRHDLVTQAAHRPISYRETRHAIAEHNRKLKPLSVSMRTIDQPVEPPQRVYVGFCPAETTESRRLHEEASTILSEIDRLATSVHRFTGAAADIVQLSREHETLIEQLDDIAQFIALLQQALGVSQPAPGPGDQPLPRPPEMPDLGSDDDGSTVAKTKH
jgi:hypothetical protein